VGLFVILLVGLSISLLVGLSGGKSVSWSV
jgi:hypothetical protein